MAAPGSPSMVSCPSCQAPVPSGSRFCNNCGAALAPPPPPPPAANPGPALAPAPPAVAPAPVSSTNAPVDIRERVDQDRGFLKKLQLLVPGYRGYRQGEDARAADSFLRIQIADKVRKTIAVVQDCRQSMTNASQFQGLMDLAPMLADLQQLEGEIRHAEQGYTGISPALRVTPGQIDRLYEYDYGFAQAADQMTATLDPLRAASGGSDAAAVQNAIATVRAQVRQLDSAFKARMRAIEGILVA